MNSSRILCSDNNGCVYGADFLKLARELDIPKDVLKSALDDAAECMREWPPSIRPANKKALRGVATLLTKAIEQLSKTGVRGRLAAAATEEPEDTDAEYADFCAWLAAQDRVDQALDGARDLLEIVKFADTIKLSSGRPQYVQWQFAIRLLLGYWIEDLRREVTISGHTEDPRGFKWSDTVQFVYRSMRLIGEEKITVQACRTVLQNLKDRGDRFGLDFSELTRMP